MREIAKQVVAEPPSASSTPEWDSLDPVVQDNFLRQHREGGIKARNIPLLKGRVDTALKPHTTTIAELKEQLANNEKRYHEATIKADFVAIRAEKQTLIAQLQTATEAKTAARQASEDYGELSQFRKVAKASEFIRMQQVTGILGALKYEGHQESDAQEIAEMEHAQEVARSAANVVGVLDLSLFR